MPQTTFTIPAATVPLGTTVFGPSNVPLGVTRVKITFDAGSYPTNQDITLHLDISEDGGTNWRLMAGSTRPGGALPTDGGGTTTDMAIDTSVFGDPQNSLRRIRGTVLTTSSFHTNGGSIVVQ